jgi:hypothetical protein
MAPTPDPFPPGGLAEWAASMAETFNAFVQAGIPPQHVAVMLGTWMGTMGNGGAVGDDGT